MNSARIVTALALVTLACSPSKSSPTPTPDTNIDGKGNGEDDGGAPKGTAEAGTTPTTDNQDSGPPCSGEATAQACVGCCASTHESGAKLFENTLAKCLCAKDKCSTDCNDTYCATTPKTPNNACNACVDKQRDNCAKPVEDACTPDEGCSSFNQCLIDAACGKKN